MSWNTTTPSTAKNRSGTGSRPASSVPGGTAVATTTFLHGGTAYSREDIIACEKKQGVSVEKGDVVLFHSGWMNIMADDPARFVKVEPGLGVKRRPD
mgnify:CR=1 FL=1